MHWRCSWDHQGRELASQELTFFQILITPTMEFDYLVLVSWFGAFICQSALYSIIKVRLWKLCLFLNWIFCDQNWIIISGQRKDSKLFQLSIYTVGSWIKYFFSINKVFLDHKSMKFHSWPWTQVHLVLMESDFKVTESWKWTVGWDYFVRSSDF